MMAADSLDQRHALAVPRQRQHEQLRLAVQLDAAPQFRIGDVAGGDLLAAAAQLLNAALVELDAVHALAEVLRQPPVHPPSPTRPMPSTSASQCRTTTARSSGTGRSSATSGIERSKTGRIRSSQRMTTEPTMNLAATATPMIGSHDGASTPAPTPVTLIVSP